MSPAEYSPRKKLESLRNALVDPEMDKRLLDDNSIPRKFLADRNIILTRHDFDIHDTAAGNLASDPPILFIPRSEDVLSKFPLNPDAYDPETPMTLRRLMQRQILSSVITLHHPTSRIHTTLAGAQQHAGGGWPLI